jgi:hypothetical protein
VQLPDITGVKAVHSFSSKHDLEGSEDDEPNEMYVFFLCYGHMVHIMKDSIKSLPTDPKFAYFVFRFTLKGRPSQIPKEKGLSDTLVFKGNAQVHGLFTYLLNLKASYEDGFLYQSPCLISGTPFLHAALKRAQVTKSLPKVNFLSRSCQYLTVFYHFF